MVMRNSVILSAVVLLLSVSSCSKDDSPSGEQLDQSPIVVMLCSPNGPGDVNYEDRMLSAVERKAKEKGLRTYVISPSSRPSGKAEMLDYMAKHKDGIKRLYVVLSPVYDRYVGLEELAAALPADSTSQLLAIGPPSTLNIHTAEINTYGLYYTAGVLAAKFTEGEEDTPFCEGDAGDEYMLQASLGFKDSICSKTDFEKALADDRLYVYGEDEQMLEDEKDYYLFQYLYGDIYWYNDLSPFCLFLTKPIFKATVLRDPQTIRNYYTAGVDMDCSIYSNRVAFSCVRHVDRLMENCIDQWLSAEGLPKSQSYGFDSEYCSLVVSPGYEYLQPYADACREEALAGEKKWLETRN